MKERKEKYQRKGLFTLHLVTACLKKFVSTKIRKWKIIGQLGHFDGFWDIFNRGY